MDAANAAPNGTSRRVRDRQRTEDALLSAVQRLLQRDGVLAGLNLNEVATQAKVNRGLIYQYFGSRRGILRASIGALTDQHRPVRTKLRQLPFPARRLEMFKSMLQHRGLTQYEALLAIDGDDEFLVFPELELSRQDLARDLAEGVLPPDADWVALHVLTAATYMGYCIFRDVYAREVKLDPDELDARILQLFDLTVRSLCIDHEGTPEEQQGRS